MTDKTVITSEAEWIEFWENLNEDWATIDLEPTLTEQLGELERAHAGYFDAAVDPGGSPWAPNAPSTVAAKGHARIMVDSERLRISLTEPGGPDAVRLVEKTGAGWEMAFGTAVEYSIFHDDDSGNRPARRHVGWDEPLVDQIVENVADAACEEFVNA